MSKITIALLFLGLAACSGSDGAAGVAGATGATGETGATGDAGLTTLSQTVDEPAGDNCATGGSRIEFGLDANKDSTLDADEISATAYVCNGSQGDIGSEGPAGPTSIVQSAPELAGVNCANGGTHFEYGIDDDNDSALTGDEIDGDAYVCNGEDALTYLIALSDEAPGLNCAAGGQKITSGNDADSSGTLETGEVTSTRYVCDGANGLSTLTNVGPENPGGNCANGGQKITVGLDADNSGALESGEVTSTTYVCNGSNGSLIVVSTQAAGVDCEYGGLKLESGPDTDGDGVLTGTEILRTDYVCEAGPSNYVALVGAPDPATVFNSPDQCYKYWNTLVPVSWDGVSNQLIGAAFDTNGYFTHAAGANTSLTTTNLDTTKPYGRIVFTPSNRVVVRGGTDQFPSAAATFEVGNLSASGTITNLQSAVFSDGFTGSCQFVGVSATEFLCYDGAVIRHYATTPGSANLALTKTVTLAAGSPQVTFAYGGTLAFDGLYYYLPNTFGSLNYSAYNLNGTLQGSYTMNGAGSIGGLTFNWGIGRYATHDGVGSRVGIVNFTAASTSSPDAECFSAPSIYHR